MILIAIFGLFLGIGIGVARLWPRHVEALRASSEHAMEAKRWSYLLHESRGPAAPVSVTRIPMTARLRANFEPYGYDTTRPYFYRWYLGYNPHDAQKHPPDPLLEELMAVCRERADHHERMRRKWAWYAWMPWVPFEPDPPKPPIDDPTVSQSF